MRVSRTCHLCEAMCGLTLTIDRDRVTDIRADADDVFWRGHICPKARALREIHGHGLAISSPLLSRADEIVKQ